MPNRHFPLLSRSRIAVAVLCTVFAGIAAAEDFLTRAAPILDEAAVDTARYLAPFAGEDLAVLDETLAVIFPNGKPSSDEARVLSVLSYIAQVYASGPPAAYHKTGAAALGCNPNLCGDKSLAMAALCRRIGIPARVVPVNNFEAINAHIVVEVWLDGGWRFMDPTYGAFFYSQPVYDGAGTIHSARTLHLDPDARQYPFFIGEDRLWAGGYDPGASFVPLPPDFRPEAWQTFTAHETLQRVFARSFPVQRAPDRPRSFPVVFDLRTDTAQSWGSVNDNPHDLSGPPQVNGATPRFHGTHFIGPGDLEDVYHTVVVHLPAPGTRVRLSYHLLHEVPTAPLEIIPLKDAIVDSITQDGRAHHIDFVAPGDLAVLLVINRGPALLLDALEATVLDPAVESNLAP